MNHTLRIIYKNLEDPRYPYLAYCTTCGETQPLKNAASIPTWWLTHLTEYETPIVIGPPT